MSQSTNSHSKVKGKSHPGRIERDIKPREDYGPSWYDDGDDDVDEYVAVGTVSPVATKPTSTKKAKPEPNPEPEFTPRQRKKRTFDQRHRRELAEICKEIAKEEARRKAEQAKWELPDDEWQEYLEEIKQKHEEYDREVAESLAQSAAYSLTDAGRRQEEQWREACEQARASYVEPTQAEYDRLESNADGEDNSDGYNEQKTRRRKRKKAKRIKPAATQQAQADGEVQL